MWPNNLHVEISPELIVQTYKKIEVNIPILILPPSAAKFNPHTRTIKNNKND